MANFELFMSQLAETNATLSSLTDFNKVQKNVGKIAMKLHQLNYLIGKDNLQEGIRELFDDNPKTFEVLDILVATRAKNKPKVTNQNGHIVLLADYFKTPEDIFVFFTQTGLAEVFQNQKITNLVDYVFGVEVGLDTNARKNRGGDIMSEAVSNFLKTEKIPFETEVSLICFPEITSLGTDVKRFDFVIRTKVKTYLIETNFYNGGGSKLNEVARAYTDIAPKINKYPNYEFVWITDGKGWESAKNKLEEAINNIPCVYNLQTLPSFIRQIKNDGLPV